MNGDYMWRQDFHFTLHCERVELYFFVGVFVFDLKKEYEEWYRLVYHLQENKIEFITL